MKSEEEVQEKFKLVTKYLNPTKVSDISPWSNELRIFNEGYLDALKWVLDTK
jgi:hypothetical protein